LVLRHNKYLLRTAVCLNNRSNTPKLKVYPVLLKFGAAHPDSQIKQKRSVPAADEFKTNELIFCNYLLNNIMVKSTPLLKKRIVKKRTLKFTRFQSDLYGGRLAESWRRPRGTHANIQALITE
jgi:hypothetical protein